MTESFLLLAVFVLLDAALFLVSLFDACDPMLLSFDRGTVAVQ